MKETVRLRIYLLVRLHVCTLSFIHKSQRKMYVSKALCNGRRYKLTLVDNH